MSRFKEVIGQVGVYVLSFTMTQFVSVLGALIIRHYLGPLQTGVWSLVQVVLSYADYANLGATYAIPIEIPFKRAQGKVEEADKIKNVIFSFSFLTSIFFSLGILIYAFVRRPLIREELFYGLLIAASIVILQQMNNALISLLRAFKNFELAGKQMALSSVINLILITLLSSIFKLYGFMLAMFLSFIFNIAYIFHHAALSFKWSLDIKVLKGLIQYGFPLMTLTFASTILLTIDKLMIARYLGLEALGLYSIAVMTSGFICSVPNAVGIVLIPNISEKYAQGEQLNNLKGYMEKSNHVFSILMPLLIGFAWFGVPLMIYFIIPKFMGGVAALKYLALGVFFIGITQTYTNAIVVSKKHFGQFPITIAVCLAALIVIHTVIKAGAGVNAVAMTMTGVMLLNFTALYFYVARHILKTRELFFEYLFVLGHFVLMTCVLLILDNGLNFLPIVFRAFTQGLILLAIYWPFLLKINSRYDAVSILRDKFFKPKSGAVSL